ncbi:hypothetical protein, partial [Klebsiella pneumoniae]|uniref:hypothetical protein n=2 Tax=Klebsiella pneumoniae TaxID=573 RepID=UPI001C704EC8
RKIGVRRITVTGFRVGVIYYRHGESGASIRDAASVNLNLRQDGRPKGGDGLPAPFTTAVSLQGRRPEKKG